MFYYGCKDRAGHFLWDPEGGIVRGNRLPDDFPIPFRTLDGGLLPPVQHQWKYHFWRGDFWMIITWWDRTVDTRPGSCSAIVMKHDGRSGVRCLIAAKEAFPWVFERQPR